MSFKYPQNFIDMCNKVYPSWKDLHGLIAENDVRNVGMMLINALGFPYDEDQIISLFRNKKETKVLEAAKFAKRKRELFNEWDRIVENHADSVENNNNNNS